MSVSEPNESAPGMKEQETWSPGALVRLLWGVCAVFVFAYAPGLASEASRSAAPFAALVRPPCAMLRWPRAFFSVCIFNLFSRFVWNTRRMFTESSNHVKIALDLLSRHDESVDNTRVSIYSSFLAFAEIRV